jgi:hypothetical protein
MRHVQRLIPPFAFLLFSIPTVHAQAQIQIGARIRITSPSGRSIGVLERLTIDTVVVGGTPIHRATIRQLEVSAGRKSHWLTGMGIGLVGGAVAGYGISAIATTGSFYGTCHADETNICPIFAGLGGGGGLLLGALIGGAMRTERWRTVQPGTIPIAPTDRPGGMLGVSIRLRF